MKKIYLLLIALLVFALILAIQNHDTVSFHLFNWTFTGSLALILILTFFLGLLVGILSLLPSIIRMRNLKNKFESQVANANQVESKNTTTTNPKS